jgi:hypothetical protein
MAFQATAEVDNDIMEEEEVEVVEEERFDSNNEEEVESIVPQEQSWYSKVEPLVQHVNEVSKRLCRHLGYALAIDEMMKKFKGRSQRTHRMKNKPVKEGYNLYALCDTQTGYVVDFFPDGRKQ